MRCASLCECVCVPNGCLRILFAECVKRSSRARPLLLLVCRTEGNGVDYALMMKDIVWRPDNGVCASVLLFFWCSFVPFVFFHHYAIGWSDDVLCVRVAWHIEEFKKHTHKHTTKSKQCLLRLKHRIYHVIFDFNDERKHPKQHQQHNLWLCIIRLEIFGVCVWGGICSVSPRDIFDLTKQIFGYFSKRSPTGKWCLYSHSLALPLFLSFFCVL